MGQLEISVFRQFVSPGMNVVDVGANLGLYTVCLACQVGESGNVTALEPVPELRNALIANLKANNIENVHVLDFAAGSANDTGTLSLDSFNSGNNWIGSSNSKSEPTRLQINIRRLDSLSLPVPDFVKIDVQGWENEVIRGMTGWLEQGPLPLIFCEISEQALQAAGSSSQILGQLFIDHGYAIHLPRLESGRVTTALISVEELSELASKQLYFDILAMPASRPKIKRRSGVLT